MLAYEPGRPKGPAGLVLFLSDILPRQLFLELGCCVAGGYERSFQKAVVERGGVEEVDLSRLLGRAADAKCHIDGDARFSAVRAVAFVSYVLRELFCYLASGPCIIRGRSSLRFYLSRIVSDVKVQSLSHPNDADSKVLKPRGLSQNKYQKDMSFWYLGPGLALGFDSFH